MMLNPYRFGPPLPPFYANRAIHFDASDLHTLRLSGSDVDGWMDKVTGQVWTQTGVNRPVVSSAAFSPRGVNFDRVSGNRKWLTGAGVTIPVPNTTFIVAHLPLTASTGLGLYSGTSSTRAQSFLLYVSPGGQKYMQHLLQVSPLIYTNSQTINSPDTFVALWRSPSTTMSTFVNERNRTNVTDTIVGTTAPSSLSVAYLGSDDPSYPSAGHIAEILSYGVALDSTQRTAVYDYLSAKWGTP